MADIDSVRAEIMALKQSRLLTPGEMRMLKLVEDVAEFQQEIVERLERLEGK